MLPVMWVKGDGGKLELFLQIVGLTICPFAEENAIERRQAIWGFPQLWQSEASLKGFKR